MNARRILLFALLLAGCETTPHLYVFNLPGGIAPPLVPTDNPMTDEKVALGRYLFYDKRLSGNGTLACGGCHQQQFAFTDGKVTPTGSTGSILARNSMSLANVAYNEHENWVSPVINMLEDQMLVPMFGDSPIELGMNEHLDTIFARLRADDRYLDLFAHAFPSNADPFTIENVVAALGCFERTILSFDSDYDREENTGMPVLTDSARRGQQAFFLEKLDCYHCHQIPTFASSFVSANTPSAGGEFRNDGIYNIDGKGAYPPNNTGLWQFTGVASDMGRFRAPTLRNIMLTGPYFHDGSAATIDDVIDSYANGGRLLTDGPYAGDGSKNPNKDPLVKGFVLSDQERDDLKAFLASLTDNTLTTDPALADPF